MSKVNDRSNDVILAANAAAVDQLQTFLDTMSALCKVHTPYRWGQNRDSIATELDVKGRLIVGRVYTQSGYGGWLEIGTSKMPARPYFAPSFLEAREMMKF